MLKLTEQQLGDVTNLICTGCITKSNGCKDFRAKLDELLGDGKKKIVFDLARVSYMDDSGVRELVTCFAVARNYGGCLKLAGLGRRMAGLSRVNRLYTVFEVFDDVGDVILSPWS